MANCARYEPTIDEIMADPVVKALMKADRVDADRLQTKLRNVRRLLVLSSERLEDERPASPPAGLARPQNALSRQLWG